LHIDPKRLDWEIPNYPWRWVISAALISMLGAAVMSQLINRPLKELSFAASRVRDGDFEASRLDEKVATSEIRQVNIGFNRMAQQLSKLEQDRALMLAGISHDLRTPLARLRLETEMSVSDEVARSHMASDISQLDAVISKFMDYARPDHIELQPVCLAEVVESCLTGLRHYHDLKIRAHVSSDLWIQGDKTELSRVISNLLENARRYGKSPYTGMAVVDIAAKARENRVLLKIRDHGMGVAPEALANLTKPFYRGDAARTAALGTGLGLSIVEKNLQRMGGSLQLVNARSGGLAAHIRMKRIVMPGE
jgi:two-component system osmolarity sensor histidine kinase EnvZ